MDYGEYHHSSRTASELAVTQIAVFLKHTAKEAFYKVPARFELALLDSESNVLTTRLRDQLFRFSFEIIYILVYTEVCPFSMMNLLWPILLPPKKRLSTFFYQNSYEKYHSTRASSTLIMLFIRNVEV